MIQCARNKKIGHQFDIFALLCYNGDIKEIGGINYERLCFRLY